MTKQPLPPRVLFKPKVAAPLKPGTPISLWEPSVTIVPVPNKPASVPNKAVAVPNKNRREKHRDKDRDAYNARQADLMRKRRARKK